MKRILTIFSSVVFATGMNAQQPIWLELTPEETYEVAGDLADGWAMPDLSWAWNSAVACFPETQKSKFTGKHMLYAVELPSYSELEIRLIPADPQANFSLYAYEVGRLDESNTVPNLNSCVRCEADHKWDYKKVGRTQDHTRSVQDILALRNPYEVLIGVAGADGLAEGAFTLEVTLRKR